MKSQIIGRIIACAIFGVLIGLVLHLDVQSHTRMSRDEFLAKQAAIYDSQSSESKSVSIGVAVLSGVAGVGVLGIYELIAFGFAKILKRVDNDKS